jgi:hypothetical protein
VEERSAVALDGGTGVVLGETEVEIGFATCAGESADARREAVDQPREFAQMFGAKNVEFRSFARLLGPSRHRSMLQEGF